jgi:hypothetical protein
MRGLSKGLSLLCLLGLLAQAGCGKKLNDDRTVQVEPAEEKLIIADPASRDQSVTVTWNADGTPVNIYLFLERDQRAASEAITLGKGSGLLDSKTKADRGVLEVQVPSGEKLVVMLTSSKPASVRVHISGK